jgi:hypothetical protein
MPLIQLKINPALVERGVKALERIADALEFYLVPKPRLVAPSKPSEADSLIEFSEEAEWQREQEEEIKGKSL